MKSGAILCQSKRQHVLRKYKTINVSFSLEAFFGLPNTKTTSQNIVAQQKA